MTAPGFHEEWFSRESQDVLAGLMAAVKNLPGVVLEIGAREGRSTVALANAAYPRAVHTCDPWDGRGHEISSALAAERDIFAQWTANVAAYTRGNVVAHRTGWRELLPHITAPIALAFVDGDHCYREVYDNLAALIPKMQPGGIICGDDAHFDDVRRAVLDLLPESDVVFMASLWVWQSPTEEGKADRTRLRAELPELSPNDEDWHLALEGTKALWQDYVENVSALDWAVSRQTAAYLDFLCRTRRPASVLDLGSGLSSAILRRWGSPVTSVDTDPAWLDRTRQFLEANRLSTTGLVLWDELTTERTYDLIFVDLAGGDTRNEAAEVACGLLNPGGVIVFDDAQHLPHQDHYRAIAARHGLRLYSLRERTVDAIERYAMLAAKPDLKMLYGERCAQASDIFLHLPKMVALVESLNAQHVIELGTRTGVSTVAWLHGLERTGGRLTSVDLDGRPDIGWWPHWTFIQGDDLAVVDDLEPADIVFIDTSHHYEQTKSELAAYLPLVRPGGVICLHDTELEVPEGYTPPPPYPVKRAVEEFVAEHGFEWRNDPECWGFAVIRIPGG